MFLDRRSTPLHPTDGEDDMNYLPKLLRYLREHPEAVESESGLTRVEIQHDGRCALLANRGPCDCDPTIAGAEYVDWSEDSDA